ncbi:MAG TPA: fluoride efflux transporter CrcB [Candidatus Omnitrophota bacterium]|nr:fluoride efflux transporter CrcB [Candidatus Omnitrophota bacterium]HPN88224.1 fluoride efflux transporter CrcB [Candidatus Omnitrophota bacterium]
MAKILFIAFGGAVGTVFRYIISGFDYRWSQGIFPIGTFIVNATGCLIIGFLWGLFERINISSPMRMFIFIGILGGYTTFSTFALETMNLIKDGEFKVAVLNILATNMLSCVAVFLGVFIARFFIRLILDVL